MKGFFESSLVQKESPGSLIARCGACGFFKDCESPKIAAYGQGAKRVLIVGEMPFEAEDQQGRPFVGKSGELLRDTLSKLGVRLDRDTILTNALICKPPKGAKIDLKHISYCRPNLLNAIKEHSPRVIIPLGQKAVVSVIKDHWKDSVDELERWVGWKIPVADYWICPTFHPAHLLQMQNRLMERQFSDHLEQAFAIDEDPPEQEDFAKLIEIIYDDEEVWKILRDFDRQGGWVAVDIETNCLKPEYEKARLVSCAVSNGERTIAYPWMGKSIEATRRLAMSPRTQKIASNIKMEERWALKTFGHGFVNWGWDTMLAAHCLDNRPGICSLKFQSFVKMGVCTYNENVDPYLRSEERYNRIEEIDLKRLLFYNGMDAILEYRLAVIQRKEMGYGN